APKVMGGRGRMEKGARSGKLPVRARRRRQKESVLPVKVKHHLRRVSVHLVRHLRLVIRLLIPIQAQRPGRKIARSGK
ncbi:MAG: hypothetical protein OXT06_18720, partial [Rhodospirillaceae bacterium]|nr:hypothetical protein [Rhodospirillaceae bacterium]